MKQNNNNITFKIIGGLGNQMFQFAAAMGLIAKSNRNLILDISDFDGYRWDYQLGLFNLPKNITTVKIKEEKNRFKRKFNKIINRSNKYKEPFWYYNPNFFKQASNYNYFTGYFQSEKYFKHIDNDIREIFTLKEKMSDTALNWIDKIKQTPVSISLHVRRGDYLNKKESKVHVAFGMEYYKKAINLMQNIFGKNVKFFIFTDDKQYVKDEFSWLKNKEIVIGDDNYSYEEIFIMASCNHHIIANSSFSWWGAWLNPHLNKKVIAPYLWFNENLHLKKNPKDIHCENWIIIR